jgi:hypothetical protein
VSKPAVPRRAVIGLALSLVCTAPSWAAAAEPPGGPDAKIYTCVDAQGRRYSSDRPIPECLSQEQRLLGRDGSPRGLLPPLNSRDEQERLEQLRQQQAQELAVRNEAVRRDRNLLSRYPDLSAHDVARRRALVPVLKLIASATSRVAALEADASKLSRERAALAGKAPSEDLKSRTSVNEGALEAQRNILKNQELERERLNAQFDAEHQRLRWLLGGMPPGTEAAPAGPAASAASGAKH